MLKDISYNYLLNEKIINIIDKNAIINDNITLTDKSIDTISRLRKSLNTNRILNDLLENVDYNFWENLGYISSLTEIQKATHKLIKYDQSYHDKQNLIDIKINLDGFFAVIVFVNCLCNSVERHYISFDLRFKFS